MMVMLVLVVIMEMKIIELNLEEMDGVILDIKSLLPLLGNILVPFGIGLDYVAVSNMRWLGPR